MAENVVEFKPKKEKGKQEDSFQVNLPTEVTEQLKAMDIHVQKMTEEIDITLANYSVMNGGPLDFTLPLEALTRSLLGISAELDIQVLPEVLAEHHQLRMDISEALNGVIQSFSLQRNTPVYSQDLYIGMGFILMSYLQQHRIFTQVRTYDTTKGGKPNGGTEQDDSPIH